MPGDLVWIPRTLIDALHDRVLAEHGGSTGLCDEGLLESALARPLRRAAYGNRDLCDLAASYAAGIVRNHPFVDGNKRTAFMAAYVFLARNGRRLTARFPWSVILPTGYKAVDCQRQIRCLPKK